MSFQDFSKIRPYPHTLKTSKSHFFFPPDKINTCLPFKTLAFIDQGQVKICPKLTTQRSLLLIFPRVSFQLLILACVFHSILFNGHMIFCCVAVTSFLSFFICTSFLLIHQGTSDLFSAFLILNKACYECLGTHAKLFLMVKFLELEMLEQGWTR